MAEAPPPLSPRRKFKGGCYRTPNQTPMVTERISNMRTFSPDLLGRGAQTLLEEQMEELPQPCDVLPPMPVYELVKRIAPDDDDELEL